ncbi:hypothetical protein HPB50_012400 [Hyalomma asiaticum]|uniref:Uncharacterized protein n=1 Tax=Hyalomma asiaticum TaxID=266040 RepID=A0ACB7S299_HYAAI|nr:hypothetical protein HPB50_012400 [Hyalomma asiaticum]
MRTTSEPATEAKIVQAVRRHNLLRRLRFRVGQSPGRLLQYHSRPTLRRLSFRQLHCRQPEQLPPARRTSPVPKIRHGQPNFQLCVGVHVNDMPRRDTSPMPFGCNQLQARTTASGVGIPPRYSQGGKPLASGVLLRSHPAHGPVLSNWDGKLLHQGHHAGPYFCG